METRTKSQAGLSTEYLDDLLMEFDQVVQDFDKGAPSQYEHHLAELKRQALPSTYDSGIDDLETKLGDTQELEEFIADLDKVLEGGYGDRIS
ncbi:hypothetical protein JD844_003931 [Phrynosoma platyrhinos]|uniref:Uncharacterized protein n=1 Tax=Phrynosoma platyrhinos TaxID=52577 RepID=A0ABQ7TM49_PHRPL|nr:hypothetical protein JD844_003931 [Phrynosoma platyrhinos]